MSRFRKTSVVHRNRRPAGASGQHLLEVKARRSVARRQQRQRMSGWILNTVLWALVFTCGYFLITTCLDKFFFKNPEYTVVAIETDLDGVLTREEALQETGLAEGMNIFTVDLGNARRVIEAIPMTDSVRIERSLPGTIQMRVKAKKPVAWVVLADRSADPHNLAHSLLVDSEGYLFKPRRVLPEFFHLPLIYGLNHQALTQGDILEAESLRSALELLALKNQRGNHAFDIRTIDVDKGYCLEVQSDKGAEVVFAPRDFPDQLDRLEMLMEHFQHTGQEVEYINLLAKRNIPVRFAVAMNPSAEHTPVVSGNSSNKSKSTKR